MKEIQLTRGMIAVVDDDVFEKVSSYKWNYSVKRGYACNTSQVNSKKTTITMHRLVMGFPANAVIDHINGNKLDNRKDNLRVVTHQQNTLNRKGVAKTSKYKGVFLYNYIKKNDGKQRWAAQINHTPYKRKQLGIFDTEKEAALAYNEAALKYHGEFALLNVIED